MYTRVIKAQQQEERDYLLSRLYNDMFDIILNLDKQYQTCFISQISLNSEYIHLVPQVELLKRNVFLGSTYPILKDDVSKKYLENIIGDLVDEVCGMHLAITKGSTTIYFGILEIIYYISINIINQYIDVKEGYKMVTYLVNSVTKTTNSSKMFYLDWMFYVNINTITSNELLDYVLQEIENSNIEFRVINKDFDIKMFFERLSQSFIL